MTGYHVGIFPFLRNSFYSWKCRSTSFNFCSFRTLGWLIAKPSNLMPLIYTKIYGSELFFFLFFFFWSAHNIVIDRWEFGSYMFIYSVCHSPSHQPFSRWTSLPSFWGVCLNFVLFYLISIGIRKCHVV